MKTSIHFDCSSGISGDMAVAALIDLGVDKECLIKALNSIDAGGYDIKISNVIKSDTPCCDFDVILDSDHENHDHDMEYLHGNGEVKLPHEHYHRNLNDIKIIINSADIRQGAKSLACRIFEILAEAEAKAHGTTVEQVHFHEVGAIDSIIDIIAFAYCFDSIGINDVIIPCLYDGVGTVRCQHGILQIPVPAVKNIAKSNNIELKITDIQGELVTPTGCAIAAAVKTDATLPDGYKIRKIGCGAGKRDYKSSGILKAYIIEH